MLAPSLSRSPLAPVELARSLVHKQTLYMMLCPANVLKMQQVQTVRIKYSELWDSKITSPSPLLEKWAV